LKKQDPKFQDRLRKTLIPLKKDTFRVTELLVFVFVKVVEKEETKDCEKITYKLGNSDDCGSFLERPFATGIHFGITNYDL